MNLEYNFDYGILLQFLRSGDYRRWDLAYAAYHHVADEDIPRCERDIDHWADVGYFGYSFHDEPGDRNPHRNYGAPHPELRLAVPASILHYYLAGYGESGESALEVIGNLRYGYENGYDRGKGEGWTECYNDYGSDSFHPFAPGLRVMAEAYDLTGGEGCLVAAERILRDSCRVADPFLASPRPGMEGGTTIFNLDMFTHSLGRYLDALAAGGLPDRLDAAACLVGLVRHEMDLCWRKGSEGYQGLPYGGLYYGTADESFGTVNLGNWHLLTADRLAYAYLYVGGEDFLGLAAEAFRTGLERPQGKARCRPTGPPRSQPKLPSSAWCTCLSPLEDRIIVSSAGSQACR